MAGDQPRPVMVLADEVISVRSLDAAEDLALRGLTGTHLSRGLAQLVLLAGCFVGAAGDAAADTRPLRPPPAPPHRRPRPPPRRPDLSARRTSPPPSPADGPHPHRLPQTGEGERSWGLGDQLLQEAFEEAALDLVFREGEGAAVGPRSPRHSRRGRSGRRSPRGRGCPGGASGNIRRCGGRARRGRRR